MKRRTGLEIVIPEPRQAHQGPLRSRGKVSVAMHGDREDDGKVRTPVDVMAGVDAEQDPSVPFERFAELLSRNRFHEGEAPPAIAGQPFVSMSPLASNQPSAASLRLDSTSSRFSPPATHPGKAGTSAHIAPSWSR